MRVFNTVQVAVEKSLYLPSDFQVNCIPYREMKRRKFDCVLYNPSRSILHMRIQLNSDMNEVEGSVQYTQYKVPFNFEIQKLEFSNAFIVIAAKARNGLKILEKVFVYKLDWKREQNFPYFAATRDQIGLSKFHPDKEEVQFIMIDDNKLLVVSDSMNKAALYSVFEIKGMFFEISCIRKACLERVTMNYLRDLRYKDTIESYFLDEMIKHLPETSKEEPRTVADLLVFVAAILPLVGALLKAVLIEVRRSQKKAETYRSRDSFFKSERSSWGEEAETSLTKRSSETMEFFDR